MEDRKDASLEADEMEKLAEKKLAELEIRHLSILQKVFLASLYFLIFFNIPYMYTLTCTMLQKHHDKFMIYRFCCAQFQE